MVNANQRIDGFTFDSGSVTSFLHLSQKEQWEDGDLESFLSTNGMRFISQYEEWDRDSGKDGLTELGKGKKVKETALGISSWNPLKANREIIQENYDILVNSWNEIIGQAFSTVKEFLPPWNHCEGTCFLVPAGDHLTYSSGEGCAVNIGMGKFTLPEWRFMIASMVYRVYLFSFLRSRSQNGNQGTPLEMVEKLLGITHREGLSTYVGTCAADDPEVTEHYAVTDEDISLYESSFLNVIEKDSFNEELIRPGSPLTCSAARIGREMARVIDESGRETGYKLGRDMLLGTLASLGFLPFFHMYRMTSSNGCITEPVWTAYDAVKRARGLYTVREDFFFIG
ncbi:MAG: hypothetical protein HXS53_10260 [Theionarchaea archaeon]|nr:hypothetical protein [Theionarchaea archaeon]